MKRAIAVFALLSLVLLVVGVGPASAGHKQGHKEPGGCEKSKGKGKGKGVGKHCYPPRSTAADSAGGTAELAPDLSSGEAESDGITVGMATIVAVAALGGLLVARRRWAFRMAQPPPRLQR